MDTGIITLSKKPTNGNRFYIEGKTRLVDPPDAITERQQRKLYDEAYSLFLSGNAESARKLLDDRKKWVRDAVTSYFQSLKNIS